MQILVKFEGTYTSNDIMLEVEPTDTILDVKWKVQDAEGIPHDVQNIIFCGAACQDDSTLSDLNVSRESTLHVDMRSHRGPIDGMGRRMPILASDPFCIRRLLQYRSDWKWLPRLGQELQQLLDEPLAGAHTRRATVSISGLTSRPRHQA